MKTRLLFLIVALTVALLPLSATSQEMPPLPATPVPGEAAVGVLAEFDIDELSTPHAEIWFLRMELEPGGSVEMGKQAGPSVVYVESGELTLIADGLATFGAGLTSPTDATPAAGGDAETIMAAEASAIVEAGTGLSFRNDGNESAIFLTLLMYPAEMEDADQTQYPEPVGLKQGGISVGTAEFMDVPATVRIERVVFEPGTTVEPELAAGEEDMPFSIGMDLGAVETGSAEVMLEYAGMGNIVWPGMLNNQMGDRENVIMTSTVQMEAGDAYAFHGSMLTWTVTGDEPLTILRVVIHPMPME